MKANFDFSNLRILQRNLRYLLILGLTAYMEKKTRKDPKFLDTRKLCCYLPKIKLRGQTFLSKWCKGNSKQ